MKIETTGALRPLVIRKWIYEAQKEPNQLLTSETEYTLSIHFWGALSSGSQLTTTPTICLLLSMTTSPTRRNTYGGRGLRTVLEAAARRTATSQRRRSCGSWSHEDMSWNKLTNLQRNPGRCQRSWPQGPVTLEPFGHPLSQPETCVLQMDACALAWGLLYLCIYF